MKRISTAIRRGALLLLCMALLPVCASAETFYATSEGNYYHLDSQCSGMQNASPMTEDGALLSGKAPCPLCIAGCVYATEQGRYYHLDSHCQGMRNASPVFAEDAILAGKQACPVCIQ